MAPHTSPTPNSIHDIDAQTLHRMGPQAFDASPWGLILLDSSGMVLRYNRTEARLSGRSPDAVVGRRFFEEIAPCTNVPEFRGRFRRGVIHGDIDTTFRFEFNFVTQPIRVAVRLLSAHEPDRYWVVTQLLERLSYPTNPAVDERIAHDRGQDGRDNLALGAMDEEICAAEPIHRPGRIRAEGAVIVVDPVDRRITHASANLGSFLGLDPEEILEARVEEVLDTSLIEALSPWWESDDHDPSRPTVTFLPSDTFPLHGVVRAWQGQIVVDLLPHEEVDECAVYRHLATFMAGPALRSDDGFGWLCQTARAVTQMDRCLLYRFDPDGCGTVIAESVGEGIESLLGLSFPASDIPPQARALYLHSRSRHCANTYALPVPLLSRSPAAVDLSFSELRAFSPYHLQYQRNLGAAASFSTSIVVGGRLWGLLIGHHGQPMPLAYAQREVLQAVTRSFEQSLEGRLGQRLHLAQRRISIAYARLVHRLTGWSMHGGVPESALSTLQEATQADGAALIWQDRVWCTAPELGEWALQAAATLSPLARDEPVYTQRLSQEWPELGGPDRPEGLALVAPQVDAHIVVLVFRRATVPRVWGRGPQMVPGAVKRWSQVKEREALPWRPEVLRLLDDLHRDLQETLVPLLQARGMVREVVERDPTAIVWVDRHGRIQDHNPAFAQLFGLDGTPTDGVSLAAYVPEWRPDHHEALEMGGRAGDHELRVQVTTVALSTSERVGDRLVYLYDVGPVRTLERKLADSRRMEDIATLATGLAHNFNNVLAVALSGVELLSSPGVRADEAAEVLRDMRVAIRSGSELASDLLTVSRNRPPESGSSDLGQVIRQSVRLLHSLCGEGVDFVWSVEEGLWVSLPSTSMQQVLFNLVRNAVDAMSHQGQLRVEARVGEDDEGQAVLRVTDSGPGIPADVQARLFQPFFTTKMEEVGTGMGLYTCQMLVRRGGGTIRAVSQPGQTMFEVRLPRGSEPPAAPVSVQADRLAPCRILLVEDGPILRRTVRRMLQRRGHTVIEHEDGEAALNAVRGGLQVDVVLTDYSMPGMSGFDLLTALQPLTEARFVILTGIQPPGLAELDRPVQLIVKPVSLADLDRALAPP